MGNGAAVPSNSRHNATADSDHTTPLVTKSQNIGGLARLAEAKSKFMNTKGRREALKASKQIKGTNFIKELYHRLDPSIALPNAVDIAGEIQVALRYNRDERFLLLKVIQARELVPRDVIGYSDPYAVVKIVPDRSHFEFPSAEKFDLKQPFLTDDNSVIFGRIDTRKI